MDEKSPLLYKDYKDEKHILSINISSDDSLYERKKSKKNSYFQKLAHFFSRDPLLLKFLLYPYQKHWPQGSVLPANDPKIIKKKCFVQNILNGASFITETVWQWILFGLLVHDVSVYSGRPDDRYGNTLGKILSGLSENELTWSAHYGSDLPGEFMYWLAPSFSVLIPLLSGITNHVINRYNQEQIAEPDEIETADCRQKFFTSVLPCHFANKKLNHARAALIADNRLSYAERHKLLGQIVEYTHFENSLIKFRAKSALADIADSLNEQDLAFLKDERVINDEEITQLRQIRQNAIARLGSAKNCIDKFYTCYQFWSLGYPVKKRMQFIFWGYQLYFWYAKTRFWEMLIQKIIGAAQYFSARNRCYDLNKIFRYTEQSAQYECSVCGDWPFVYYGDQFTAQGCLNGFLSVRRTASETADAFERLVSHTGITSADFSGQNWADWTEEEWKTVLDSMRPVKHLKNLNLSLPLYRPYLPYDNKKIALLSRFLSVVPTHQLSLRNQGLGAQGITDLKQGLNHTEFLDLSFNDLGDDGAAELADVWPKMHVIKTMKLQGNRIGDDGMIMLSRKLPNTTITELDISGNQIEDEGLREFADMLPYSQLRSADLSEQVFSADSLGYLSGTLSEDAPLKIFRLRSAQLMPRHIQFFSANLSSDSLTELDLYENNLGDEGTAILLNQTKDSSLITLNVGNNDITDQGAVKLSDTSSESSVQSLDISDNQIRESGFLALVKRFSQLLYLKASGNVIGDRAAVQFAGMLKTGRVPLQFLDLSNTGLTVKGGRGLIGIMPHTNITHLILAGNDIGDQSASYFFDVLSGTRLLVLDLSDVNLHDKSIIQIAEILSRTPLEQLRVSGNTIGNQGALRLAQHLITEIPNLSKLGDKHISRDMRRAISKARAATKLRTLNLKRNEIGESLALCRVLPRTEIGIQSLQLDDLENCQTSGADRAEPWFIFRWLRKMHGKPKHRLPNFHERHSEFFRSSQRQTEWEPNTIGGTQNEMVITVILYAVILYICYCALRSAAKKVSNLSFFNYSEKKQSEQDSDHKPGFTLE